MADITVKLSAGGDITAAINNYPKELASAAQRAVNQVGRWGAREAAKRIAAVHGLPLRVVRNKEDHNRISYHSDNNGRISYAVGGVIWVGRNPIKSGYLGSPYQTPEGAGVGPHFWPHSFVVTMDSGHKSVFHRTGATRLPIKERAVELQHAEPVAKAIAAELPAKLNNFFEREMGRLHGKS